MSRCDWFAFWNRNLPLLPEGIRMNDWCRISWESNPALKQNPVHKHIGFSLSPERQFMESRRRIEATSLRVYPRWHLVQKNATTFYCKTSPMWIRCVVATNDPFLSPQAIFWGFPASRAMGCPVIILGQALLSHLAANIQKDLENESKQTDQKVWRCLRMGPTRMAFVFHEKLWETWINIMQSIDTYWYWKSGCLTEPR